MGGEGILCLRRKESCAWEGRGMGSGDESGVEGFRVRGRGLELEEAGKSGFWGE